MERKTAIAAALAITMSLGSGVVALSANAGALGFGRSTPVAATQSVVVTPPARAQSAPAKAAEREGEHDDSGRTTQIGAERATSAKGEHDD